MQAPAIRDCPMAPITTTQQPAVMSTDTGVKDSVSTTCSVSAMSISSVDVELDPDVRVICRDFIRGVCGRKRRCKFQHPDANALDALVECNPAKKYAFCHDFQNKTCERSSCKYIHCSSEEEQNYLKNNVLSLKYKCQYELGIYNIVPNQFKLPTGADSRKGSMSKYSPYTSENEHESKRHRSQGTSRHDSSFSVPLCRSSSEYDYGLKAVKQQLLEEPTKMRNEIEQLKKRISELQQQVANLTTMNDMLLEQNAQYRHNNRNQSTPATPTIHQQGLPVAQHIPVAPQVNLIPNGYAQQAPPPPQMTQKYVMTPVSSQAVITTVPPAASAIMQPPVSTHAPTVGNLVQLNQMRPPPGIPHQAVAVQPPDVAPAQRYSSQPNMPVQIIGNMPVANVQTSVQTLAVQPSPVQTTMPPPQQPVQPELGPNQVTVAYQPAPRQGAPPPAALGGPGTININGYADMNVQRISVHHQQHQ